MNLPSVWQAALTNQNFVEYIQGYVTDNAKAQLAFLSEEAECSFVLFCIIYFHHISESETPRPKS